MFNDDDIGGSLGLTRIPVTLFKEDDSLTLLVQGVSPENRLGPMHGTWHLVRAATAVYLFSYFFRGIPPNAGLLETCRYLVEGPSIANATDELAHGMGTSIAACVTNGCHVLGSKALFASPYRIAVQAPHSRNQNVFTFAGENRRGYNSANITGTCNAAGQGGRFDGDGESAIGFFWGPFTDAGETEDMDSRLPHFVLSRAIDRNNHGYGKFRGGASLVEISTACGDPGCFLNSWGSADKISHNPGIMGGYMGPPNPRIVIEGSDLLDKARAGGEVDLHMADLMAKRSVDGTWRIESSGQPTEKFAEGDLMIFTMGGGGGYGDVLERDPAAIQRDVDDGMIDPHSRRAGLRRGHRRRDRPHRPRGDREEAGRHQARAPAQGQALRPLRRRLAQAPAEGPHHRLLRRLARAPRAGLRQGVLGVLRVGENPDRRPGDGGAAGEHVQPGVHGPGTDTVLAVSQLRYILAGDGRMSDGSANLDAPGENRARPLAGLRNEHGDGAHRVVAAVVDDIDVVRRPCAPGDHPRLLEQPPAGVRQVLPFVHRARRYLPEPSAAEEPIRLLLRGTKQKVFDAVAGASEHPEIEEVGAEVEGHCVHPYLTGVRQAPCASRSGPEIGEAERDRVEGGDAHRTAVPRAPDEHPLATAELERLEGVVRRVDEPEVTNPFAGVNRALAMEVEAACRRRKYLAHPVRCESHVGSFRIVRHPFPAPAREVGNQNVLAEVQLGLVDDPPSSRTPSAELKRIPEIGPQRGARECVWHCRPRVGVQGAVDDLRYAMCGRVEHVLIGGPGYRIRRRFGGGAAHGAHLDSIVRSGRDRRREPGCGREGAVRRRSGAR